VLGVNSTRDHAAPERQQFCRDRYSEQRAAAIEWLGLRWRGRADCRHEYIPAAERRLKQEQQS
jgi:hypothetical protein